MVQAGVPPEEAYEAILPLARGVLNNLEGMGPARALTGPVARGDVETVRLHLRTLPARERSLYAALGLEILHHARNAGLAEDTAEELKELLEREK
jgi:predicted short-subunit dehydrogenase-like oxidoreductase (DUF2520 family)